MTAIAGREAVGPQAVGLVQQFVHRTGQLYSLPAVAVEVLRLTGESRVDARALKDCIERDPALATRLLRVVNSSLFGVSRQVTDLGQALTLLGTRPLKMLVLGFSLPKDLFTGLEASVLARYWRRTLVKAVAARDLAERLWQASGDEPFIAGLIQDIGMLALVQQLGDSYVQFLDHVQTHGGSLLDRELDSLGFDHIILSSRLLAHWGLPPALCSAIAVPPDEARIAELPSGGRMLPQILHLAELLARLVEQPYGPALRDLLNVGARYCGLTYDTLQSLVAEVQRKVAELADVLSLELPAGSDYVDLLMAAQQRLSTESFQVAAECSAAPAEEQLLSLANQMRRELHVAGTVRSARPHPGRVAAPLAEPHRDAPAFRAPLADDAGLPGAVGAAVQRCRQARLPFTLAIFQVDHFGDVLLMLGPAAASELVHGLRSVLADWTSQRAVAALVSDSALALVFEDCPRSEAVHLARYALSMVKPWATARFDAAELTLSAGLATIERPPKNFQAQELIDGAQRCLSAAELSGGDTVKSFEL
jgi:HD-like signal output (HDOD) protein/GGDEF domain-containing protein